MTQTKVSYEYLFWFLFISTTAVTVVDRFTWNVWTRQTFATPGHGTGTDRIPLKTGPWSVVMYDIIARVSGRYTMFAMNALFFTMMHTSYHFLSTSAVSKVVDFSDDSARNRIHRYIGISLCVITILHVVSILFPVMFSGFDVVVNPGYFSWPLSEQTPSGFKDANSTAKLMMMQVDDVYRLILMTVMLGPLMYYCVQILKTNFRFGIRLHQFIAIMYFIDIARRHTHPHSWCLNVPVFLLWGADKLVGKYLKHKRVEIQVDKLNDEYVLLTWKDPSVQHEIDHIGNIYNVRSTELSALNKRIERRHPFTTFKNRMGVLSVARDQPKTVDYQVNIDGDENKSKHTSGSQQDWDVGILCKVYNGKRSHTKCFRTEQLVDVFGGYHESNLVERLEQQENLFLVGGGSGVAYIIDTLSFLASRNLALAKEQHITMVFTTKHVELARWFCSIVQSLHEGGFVSDKQIKLHVHVTGTHESFEAPASQSWGNISLGRCNFRELLSQAPSKTQVFCQGSPGLQQVLKKSVKSCGNGLRYHGSAAFGTDGKKRKDNRKVDIGSSSVVTPQFV